jgi:hypothetical protein
MQDQLAQRKLSYFSVVENLNSFASQILKLEWKTIVEKLNAIGMVSGLA